MHPISPRLLITDDDRAMRMTLQSALEQRGFHTLLASDGEEALRLFSRERVDLALLDIHMPRLSGLEAMRQMRRQRSELPCILMSAALDEQLLAKTRELAANRVLAKPFALAEMMRAVNDVLAHHRGEE